jgi:hypothetical protein
MLLLDGRLQNTLSSLSGDESADVLPEAVLDATRIGD